MDLGRSIKTVRVAQGMQQIELAERVGVSQSYMSRVESNLVVPTEPQLEQIKAVLHWPDRADEALEILGGNGEAQ